MKTSIRKSPMEVHDPPNRTRYVKSAALQLPDRLTFSRLVRQPLLQNPTSLLADKPSRTVACASTCCLVILRDDPQELANGEQAVAPAAFARSANDHIVAQGQQSWRVHSDTCC